MMLRVFSMLMLSLSLITGCGSDNALTQQEIEIQSRADIAVSNILFDAGMDNQASYHVRKNGHVEIEFVKTVPMFDYTMVVEKMRAHPDIKSVTAVQTGQEVCPMREASIFIKQ